MRSDGTSRGTHVLVVAKSPVAGQVKTRLCPPLTPVDAARVAEASLAQTLQAVARCTADRKLLALEGEPGGWIPPGFTVFAQTAGSLDQRLAAAWSHAGGPGLQIGMDTPQVTAELLDQSLLQLCCSGVTAVLGPAVDGGWWAVGLRDPHPADVFSGVAMSTPTTGRRQLKRLLEAGYTVGLLPTLRDIDTAADADCIARSNPDSLLAAVWASAAANAPS